MSRDRKPEPVEKLPDWCVAEALSDGSIRVAPQQPKDRGPFSIQEEWRIGPNSVEVRRALLGSRWARRYSGAELAICSPLGSAAFGRSLTVSVGGNTRVIAIGDAADIRALGTFLARRTGWPLRISQSGPTTASRRPVALLAGLFVLGGLVVGTTGFRQYRGGAVLLRRLGATEAADLERASTGALWMATGRIEVLASDNQRLALYDRYVHQYRPKEGDPWELADSPRPEFSLSQGSGVIHVFAGGYRLLRPPHGWTDANERYEGFRSGDLATVVGTVGSDGQNRGLKAHTLFGGTALQLSELIRRQGMLGIAAGAGSSLVGAVLLLGLSRPRRHRRE
jgi:hypothetical protein